MAGYYDKIDGNLLMATLAAQDGATVSGEHGVQFVRADVWAKPRFIGTVNINGIDRPARFFYRVQPWQEWHARKLVEALNKQLYHDGAWSVLWTAPSQDGIPTRLNIAWQDADGDVCFVIEVVRSLLDLMNDGPESHLGNCEKAWKEYVGFMTEAQVTKDQKIKAAQGQESVNPKIQPII